jgi:prepilin peptidase CpaA
MIVSGEVREMIVAPLLTATFFAFCLAVIYGALSDVATYTIPNWVSYGLAALFAVFAALTWQRTPVLWHVGLGLAVFFICMVFWKLRWLGGGDVKFVGAIALWMGPADILPFLILLSVLSGVLVVLLLYARLWGEHFQGSRLPEFFKRMIQKGEKKVCPYGLPAAIAALIVVPQIVARSY